MSRRADRTADRSARPPPGRWADGSGFTLVEVLVAFTVMATVLGVLYRTTVQTRAGALDFGARMRDEAIALSLLDEFRARRDLADGRTAGERDGRHWTLTAARIDLADQLPKGADPPAAGEQPSRRADAKKPAWVMQRLVLRVDTAGRPLEAEALHLVRLPAEAR